jgi:hypothetical protein
MKNHDMERGFSITCPVNARAYLNHTPAATEVPTTT